MRILITGITGRVGSTLAPMLIDRGHRVRGMVRSRSAIAARRIPEAVDLHESSLSDSDGIAKAVSGVDAVVHLAAQIVMGDTLTADYFDTNVMGTLRLLEAVAIQKNNVHFVYASTDNTYGPGEVKANPVDETHEQIPGDYYGTSKVLSEHLVRNYQKIHGFDYTILRYGSVITPDEAAHLYRLDWAKAFLQAQLDAGKRSNLARLFEPHSDAVEKSLKDSFWQQPGNPAVILDGPGGSPWSIHLTDVRDAAQGTVLAIENEQARNESFNVVGPRSTSFSEGAKNIAAQFEVGTVSTELPMTLAFELSTAKARRLLGYRPTYDFAASLVSRAR
ncbi:NAD-dependent epimerase/dehydratase family protein [Amycolatopsis acidicola]|nr:NAD(P)-dependent oxidoreductase [Amycolatopsis acidicola]